MTDFVIEPRGRFSLAAAAQFIAEFPPLARPDASQQSTLRIAFATDRLDGHAAVSLRERDGAVHGTIFGTADADAVRRQVARILCLDRDATGFEEIGRRDPVVSRLQRQLPGLRPVLFHSPYEAAAWSVISTRMRVGQAVAVRRAIEREVGERFEVEGDAGGEGDGAGEVLTAFPTPERLRSLQSVEGLPGEKLRRLHGVAEAALEGRLDPDRLRALDEAEAMTRLQTIPGIGPFYAGLILVRAVGATDVLPMNEPRIRKAAARAYGLLAPPDDEEFTALAEPWRPFRSWVCLLLRVGS